MRFSDTPVESTWTRSPARTDHLKWLECSDLNPLANKKKQNLQEEEQVFCVERASRFWVCRGVLEGNLEFDLTVYIRDIWFCFVDDDLDMGK